ncbi:MAG: DEAD/DEAH box helicase [Bryobacterales bacterium]|nr:DEAD/DEAH box helicase [Bryobacterales bacterium]
MLFEQQILERRARAKDAIAGILTRPQGQPFGDYRVKSASGKTYRVAMRGPGLFENYCSCPDFAVNTLGTCKHIEALLQRLHQRHGKALDQREFKRTRASISLIYGDTLDVRLRLPAAPSPALAALAEKYFDPAGLLLREHFRQFERVLEDLRKLDDQAVVYSDVLEYIDRENEVAEGLELEGKLLADIRRGKDPSEGLLKTRLLAYQVRGALFAACRGRVVLADDMGLGKTIQALAAAEMLRRRRGIERVLVIAPASVKYQWKTEIEKFTNLSAQVIDGLLPRRKQLYASPAFFNLTSYEVVLKDLELMRELRPDLIILDEAQRIRNWTTATARTIKQLKSRYAFVLTGTPLENKLEELFSVVEFVDGRRLGPAFRFLQEHRMEDEKGRLLGYRGLDRIHQQLDPILLRRTRKEVLTELPPRTDQIFRVPLTEEQAGPYWEQNDILARLMHKWQRQGWLSEIDLRRITCCIQNMRMLCNSTFLFDKQTNHSPKLEEFREIIRELALEENRKVVVFSEYERMTHLAGVELGKLGIAFVSLHGGVPAPKRGALMDAFRRDPDCKVFLSTDAGGVGLNLQAASAVINFEPPWNPARLEQRIGRVHRMGQSQPVQAIHFLTSGSIEERVWETLRIKKSLFAGVFDSPTDEVSFAALGKKSVLQAIKEVFAEQAETPPPAPAPVPQPQAAPAPPPQAVPAPPPVPQPQTVPAPSPASVAAAATQEEDIQQAAAATPEADIQQAAGSLIEAGIHFIESLVPKGGPQASAEAADSPIARALSNVFQKDPRTNRPMLAIPLPESVTRERLAGALAGLLNSLTGRS